MKTYFPYYFRKIGISFVIIAIGLSIYAGINDAAEGFQDGWNSAQQDNEELLRIETNIISQERSKTFTWISLAFSFSGLLLYIFSREKIEDEFIQNLRYKSLVKAFFITWIVLGLTYILQANLNPERIDIQYKNDGLYILQFQLVLYVIIYNYYKKWKFTA